MKSKITLKKLSSVFFFLSAKYCLFFCIYEQLPKLQKFSILSYNVDVQVVFIFFFFHSIRRPLAMFPACVGGSGSGAIAVVPGNDGGGFSGCGPWRFFFSFLNVLPTSFGEHVRCVCCVDAPFPSNYYS